MNPDDAPKVKEIRERIAKYGDNDALANEVFSHLSSFFRRYYDNGDFLSLRRYKKIPTLFPMKGGSQTALGECRSVLHKNQRIPEGL